jgi:hypothetical protein
MHVINLTWQGRRPPNQDEAILEDGLKTRQTDRQRGGKVGQDDGRNGLELLTFYINCFCRRTLFRDTTRKYVIALLLIYHG